MMNKVFAIRDAAVGEFMQPFFARSKGEAVRTFTDAVNDVKSPFFAHARDFGLYGIGEYDTTSGVIDGCAPDFVISAEAVIMKDVSK